MSGELTAVEALHAFARGRAELALLEALAVLLEAVGALARAALLDGRGLVGLGQVQLANEGVGVLVQRVLHRLVPELLLSPRSWKSC